MSASDLAPDGIMERGERDGKGNFEKMEK